MEGTKRRDAMQFFNRAVAAEVMVGARVFGMPLEKYKTMSRRVISAGSNNSHFQRMKALDEAIRDCQESLQILQELCSSLYDQSGVVGTYRNLKIWLPNSFI
ncbi:unnamed protein product [Sphagnum balticum]